MKKTVIITGATGFLGIHVVKACIDNTEAKITCVMRKGGWETVEQRLKALLMQSRYLLLKNVLLILKLKVEISKDH